jgi:hypothetical protein
MPDGMSSLAAAYEDLTGWTPQVGQSLSDLLATVLHPFLPSPQFTPSRFGIFFRDWPVPCMDKLGFAPEERGAAKVPADIMSGSVDRVFENGGTRYATLRRGFVAAHAVARHLRDEADPDLERFVRSCVVGDLVKLQAPFCGMGGERFEGALSKRSCHSWGMYGFAGPLFSEELDILDLRFVVGFGARSPWAAALQSLKLAGWQVHIPTDGSGNRLDVRLPAKPLSGRHFVLLPHPQAYGHALNRAVRVVIGSECILPPPPIPDEVEEDGPDRPDPRPHRAPPPEAFYARIEDWLEAHFGAWEIEPHHANSMRSFKPQGKRCGAIYGRTPRGRKLVFICSEQEKWANTPTGFRISRGDQRRIVVHIPDDADLSALNAVLDDWE